MRLVTRPLYYALPPKRRRSNRGRPPKKGKRLPTPKQLAVRRREGWRTIPVRIDGRVVTRRVLSIGGLRYHVIKDRPIKRVIVRDPSGRQRNAFLLCTDPTASEVEIVERFAARYSLG